jgi:aryl-alcohol dehydrogenase-like predicted oxidoreductase
VRYRKLGRTGLGVSEIGFGSWGIGADMWVGGSDAEATAALRCAFELGLNFVDTALIYGRGHSERITGAAIREAGLPIRIATKVPPKNGLWPARPGIDIREVFPYDYILSCTDQSLRNLGVDSIDLQQLHVWNPEWLDCDEWKRAFADLKSSGKVRAVGVSINDHLPDTALDVVATGLIDTVQVIYNVFDQTPAERLFPLTRRHGVGVLARVPLDEGSLTGQITSKTKFNPNDFRARYFGGDRKRQVVERIAALTKELGVEIAALPEIALRFCISDAAVSSVIPGMRNSRHVESNCSVSDKGPLPPEMLAILRRHAWTRNFYDWG